MRVTARGTRLRGVPGSARGTRRLASSVPVVWLPAAAMTRRREHRVTVMAKPVLMVVDDEDASLQALARELESRYGAHYQVVSGSSAEVALARLAELKAAGGEVPLGATRPLH